MATEGGTSSIRLAWMDALLSTPNDEAHGDLDAFARAVAWVLYRHMNPQGLARPGTRTLAQQSGASHPIVEDRLRRLEAAGWLTVVRASGKTSRYSAVIPASAATPETAQSGCAVDGTEDEPRNRATAQSGCAPDAPLNRATAQSHAETAQPDCAKPEEPTTAASTQTTYERRRPKRNWQPKVEPSHRRGQPVTGEVLWPTMAIRKLRLEREATRSARSDLPPVGSFREHRLLETIEDELANLHTDKAKQLRGKLPADDLERFIYELDPTLSKHGWGPQIAAAEARRKQAEAEREARLAAMTPEDVARAEAEAEAAKAEVIANLKKPKQQRPKRTNLDGPPSPYQVPEAS